MPLGGGDLGRQMLRTSLGVSVLQGKDDIAIIGYGVVMRWHIRRTSEIRHVVLWYG